MKNVFLPQFPWDNSRMVNFKFPDNWQIETYNIKGYNKRSLTSDEIENIVKNPMGMKPLRELAKNKREAVILFDDISRVTRASEIIPFILEELIVGGIEDDKIRFIAALGSHGCMSRTQFVKKLGKEVVDRYPVYNHNAFDNYVYLGKTSHDVKISVNAEVMNCDLKIAISLVVPHPQYGFGGGPKIILPGISSIETIIDHHSKLDMAGEYHNIGKGDVALSLDFKEAAKMVGLDMSINCLVNLKGETVSMYAGSLDESFNAAVEEAKIHYLTNQAKDKDIVILNNFIKSAAMADLQLVGYDSVNKKGGDIVLFANTPEGQVTHFQAGIFGNNTGAKSWGRMKLPSHVNHLILYSEYPEHSVKGYYEKSDKVILVNNWEKVINMLQEFHKGNPKVAVYPSNDIQIFRK